MEEWKLIPGFDNYIVSNLGRIIGPSGVPLKGTLVNGYRYVTFGHSDGRMSFHSAVLKAFTGEEISSGQEVRHLNGDPTDNRLINLKIGTKSENTFDQVIHGTHNNASKEECLRGHSLSPENVRVYKTPKGSESRFCKECDRIRGAKYRARKKREKELADNEKD